MTPRKYIPTVPFFLIASVLVLLYAREQNPPAQGAPERKSIVHTEFFEPPDTLRGMMVGADAVVEGRITAVTPRDRDGARPMVFSAYHLKVAEVFQLSSAQPITTDYITVLRVGGDRTRGTSTEQVDEEDFPRFQMGHAYVLFLRWNLAMQAWMPAWGPDSVFETDDAVVRTNGRATHVRAQDGKPTAEFLELIRRNRG